MSELKDEDIFDQPFAWGFDIGQSPTLINYVARLNGIEAKPLSEPFTYCELGCGNGLTINILAASLPQGDFYGVEWNPECISNGRRIADKGRLSNLTFIENSFERLPEEDLPEFDYITLHGVYSWVGAKARQDIVKVIDKSLKPGGLVYVDYNAMPVWAPLVPLAQIMLTHTAGIKVGPLKRAAEGMKYLKFLRDNNAGYFEQNPGAGTALDSILKYDLPYIAFEYFNPAWHPLYFTEVASDMARAGLDYCGTVEVARNYSNVTAPHTFRGLLDTDENAFVREPTIRVSFLIEKSLVRNQPQRCDVYCKSRTFLPPAERTRLFADTVFGSQVPDQHIKRKARVEALFATYSGKIYDELIPMVAEGTRTVAEICTLPEMRDYPKEVMTNSINYLVAGGQFQPFATRAPAVDGKQPERFRIVSNFNRALLEERLIKDTRATLASGVLGNGVTLRLIPGLLLLGCDAVGPEEAIDYACGLLEKSGESLPMSREAKVVTDPAKRRKSIAAEMPAFRDDLVPLLLRYGVIEPVSG